MKRTEKKYRIDIVFNPDKSVAESHYTDHLDSMVEKLTRKYGTIYNRNNGTSFYTLDYTDWRMRIYDNTSGKEIKEDWE